MRHPGVWQYPPEMQGTTSAIGMARAAIVLSALSLIVSLVGVTPADAVRAVKHALNADKVGGIRASRTPRPGRLLPLGADRRFPAAVLPQSVRGPRGPEGPRGATGPPGSQGPAGLSNIRLANGAPVSLSPTASVNTQVARLDHVPAGSWLVTWSATFDYPSAQLIGVFCNLQAGQLSLPGADASVGTVAGAQYADVLGSFAATTQAQTFDVQLVCRPGANTASAIHVDDQRIVAIRADSIDVTG